MTAGEENPKSKRDPIRDAVDKLEQAIDEIDFDEAFVQQIVERPLRRQTWSETLYLLSTIPAAIVALLIWSVGGPVSIGLLVTIIGIPLLILVFWLFRKYAVVERKRLRIVDKEPLEVVYAKPEGNLIEKGTGYLSDVQTWKDVGWMVFLSLIGFPVAVFALSLWLIAAGWIVFPAWGWALPDMTFLQSWIFVPLGLLMIIVATWVCAGAAKVLALIQRAALGSTEEQLLRGRVTELERTREESLAQQSTEMSRIERDLHDGAQARLVALAMDLGMAEQKLDEDPEAAKKLVSEARDEAQRTLQELRDLVRGIGPQILRDRGLEAALDPLAARSPIPVELGIDLDERPGERVETAAYFVASEALANAIKHSTAERININAWRHDQWLYVRVSDNGVGGADAEGEGLHGLRARVEAVDGRLMVSSPSGGPTIIDAWLPMK